MYRLFLIPLTIVSVCFVASLCRAAEHRTPDIVLMMADDLGFSDLGCYGSEIPTPHLDQLANNGVAFTNFSNTSRCCPSRASLLTGLYAHQAGLGGMTYRGSGRGYQGQLAGGVKTLPERLRLLGYQTAMVGKWHQTLSSTIDSGPNGSWPLQRGFDRFFGTMEGAKNYFHPKWLFDDSQEITEFPENFFYTNAISRRAADWIARQEADEALFLYTAFYAPHFPLQAPGPVIARHRGKYLIGWDELRERRLARQKDLGVIPQDSILTERRSDIPAWKTLDDWQKKELDLRMATYAAQVELLDQGVGRIVEALKDAGRLDNTLIIFLSDNGAASSGGAFGDGPVDRVGKVDAPIRTTYGKGWATLSNTPYRMHKANTHEGGVMAPLILHWPKQIAARGKIRADVAHIIDIAPTCLGAASRRAADIPEFEGIDLLADRNMDTPRTLFYEHEKSRAVRQGRWKLVNRWTSREWELYDLHADRTELNDLAAKHPDRVMELASLWKQWAVRCHVRAY